MQLRVPEVLIDWCVTNIADLEVEKCGAGGHHTPEDQPEAIAAAISAADRTSSARTVRRGAA